MKGITFGDLAIVGGLNGVKDEGLAKSCLVDCVYLPTKRKSSLENTP